jgi:hypothetical protein
MSSGRKQVSVASVACFRGSAESESRSASGSQRVRLVPSIETPVTVAMKADRPPRLGVETAVGCEDRRFVSHVAAASVRARREDAVNAALGIFLGCRDRAPTPRYGFPSPIDASVGDNEETPEAEALCPEYGEAHRAKRRASRQAQSTALSSLGAPSSALVGHEPIQPGQEWDLGHVDGDRDRYAPAPSTGTRTTVRAETARRLATASSARCIWR